MRIQQGRQTNDTVTFNQTDRKVVHSKPAKSSPGNFSFVHQVKNELTLLTKAPFLLPSKQGNATFNMFVPASVTMSHNPNSSSKDELWFSKKKIFVRETIINVRGSDDFGRMGMESTKVQGIETELNFKKRHEKPKM